ncbi:hypothetical protein [Bradyrhizobium nanningense]|uniref:hypothetical protein n=1 Tax=Bradyrhizobium nanningense TaxID=1325118 RepID=UPI0010088E13|nr:hypothetical protein [Bradyrhizobium nanningense]
MRIIIVLIASALINVSAIPGFAAERKLNKDVDGARVVSGIVPGKPDNATANGKTCRAYAASFYESEMLRQAAADRVGGARMFTTLNSVINAFGDLFATKCTS